MPTMTDGPVQTRVETITIPAGAVGNEKPILLVTETWFAPAIDAVVQLTKTGWAFVFDRVTGKPVWPIEERAVPASDAPGEKSWPTQPFPTRPPAFEAVRISWVPGRTASNSKRPSEPVVKPRPSSRRSEVRSAGTTRPRTE